MSDVLLDQAERRRICTELNRSLLVEAGADTVQNSGDVLAHRRPVGTATVELDFGGRREEPRLRLAEPLQKAARAIVPQGSQLKDFLSGTWLGHPLHPPLTDVVVGAWTSALLLDLLGGRRSEEAADRLVAAGVLAAVPTAASGLSDWAELRGGSRRVGTVHALGNAAGLALHMLSLRARRRGNRGAAA